MDDKILDGLSNIGYSGNLLNKQNLEKVIEQGTKSVEFTKLVNYLCSHLKNLCNIDEEVNVSSSPNDSSAFIMEISSFLKELNCPYKTLTSGHVSERLEKREDKQLLLDFLIATLMTARITNEREPRSKMALNLRETSEACSLKQILIALGIGKPPQNITIQSLFQKMTPPIEMLVKKAPEELLGIPMFSSFLSDKQWEILEKLRHDFHEEYKIRREMLLTRLDVTLQSFQWSDRTKSETKDKLNALYKDKRHLLNAEPGVRLADLLSARTDIAIMEKTSNSFVRKNTCSSFQKIIIGQVPDRGGRTSELAPPPPEMPSWAQRVPGPTAGIGNRGSYNSNNQNYSRRQFDKNSSRGNENTERRSNYTPFSNFDTSLSSYSFHKPGESGCSASNDSYQSQKRSYIAGDGNSQTAFDSAGTYETNKKAKSYDNFRNNPETYTEQYVNDRRGNERYHHQQRGGRSNYRRERGNHY